MLAFLTEVMTENVLTLASLGILLIVYVCKRIFGKSYKRRINNMIPNEIKGHADVQSEVSDVVKELEDLSFTLAKYGYVLTFTVDIKKMLDVDDHSNASEEQSNAVKEIGYINE